MTTMDLTRKLARLEFSATPARLLAAGDAAQAAVARMLDLSAIALAAEQSAARSGRWTWRWSTPRSGASSAGPSAASRRSSTGAPTCCVDVESLRSAVYYAAGRRRPRHERDARRGLAGQGVLPRRPTSTWPRENIQIHGGIGFTWEHDAHLYLKRAKASELLLGDGAYHRERLANRIGI